MLSRRLKLRCKGPLSLRIGTVFRARPALAARAARAARADVAANAARAAVAAARYFRAAARAAAAAIAARRAAAPPLYYPRGVIIVALDAGATSRYYSPLYERYENKTPPRISYGKEHYPYRSYVYYCARVSFITDAAAYISIAAIRAADADV